jgi:hypothetical protein
MENESSMIADYLWLFATAGSAIIVGIALVYVFSKRRRLGRVEQSAQDHKVREMYHKNEK